MSPARWQPWQCCCITGAISLLHVTDPASPGWDADWPEMDCGGGARTNVNTAPSANATLRLFTGAAVRLSLREDRRDGRLTRWRAPEGGRYFPPLLRRRTSKGAGLHR